MTGLHAAVSLPSVIFDEPLRGGKAVVTGAGRGIGSHIAVALARAGADVAVTARDAGTLAETVREIRDVGPRAFAVQMDLLDRGSVEPAFAAITDELGGIDVLVCNSGVGGPSAPIQDVSDADWDETLAVNLTGTFLCIRAAAPRMLAAGAGSIVVIGSMTGKRPLLHRSPYAASKLALVALCRTAAFDLGPGGVRVNLVSPGFVAGDRLDWVIDAQAQASGRPVADVRVDMMSASPLGRFTTPDEVANAVVLLASPAASGITGEDVNVSSGLVMY